MRSTTSGKPMAILSETTFPTALTPLSVRAARIHWTYGKGKSWETAPYKQREKSAKFIKATNAPGQTHAEAILWQWLALCSGDV